MSLEAWVFCDCFEKHRLREPPPAGCRLAVTPDGSLNCGSGDLFVQTAFSKWLHDRACDHKDGCLTHCSIGNDNEIRALYELLGQFRGRYSILRSQVLIGADRVESIVAPDQLSALRAEIFALADTSFRVETDMVELIQRFGLQMTELVECAIFAGKPIALRKQ